MGVSDIVWMSSSLMAKVSLLYRTLQIKTLYDTCPLTFSKMPLSVCTGCKLWKFFQAAFSTLATTPLSPVVTALAEDWITANTFRANTAWPFNRTWLDWQIVFAAYRFYFTDFDMKPLCIGIIFPDWASFSSPLLSLPLTPNCLHKGMIRDNQLWISLIRLP